MPLVHRFGIIFGVRGFDGESGFAARRAIAKRASFTWRLIEHNVSPEPAVLIKYSNLGELPLVAVAWMIWSIAPTRAAWAVLARSSVANVVRPTRPSASMSPLMPIAT